jgi:hypothetical protein
LLRHPADFPPFGLWIDMIENEHIRVVDRTPFPLALFCLQQFIEPLAIAVRFRFVAFVVTTRVSFIMFPVNRFFTGATVRLQAIRIAPEPMVLACIFYSFASETLFRHDSALSYLSYWSWAVRAPPSQGARRSGSHYFRVAIEQRRYVIISFLNFRRSLLC